MRDDHLVPGVEGCPTDEREQLVGAIADDDLGGGDAQTRRQRLAQCGRAPIGVEVDTRGFARDGLDDAWRWAERALVGRKPDEVRPTEIERQRLQGSARIVRRDAVDGGTPDT